MCVVDLIKIIRLLALKFDIQTSVAGAHANTTILKLYMKESMNSKSIFNEYLQYEQQQKKYKFTEFEQIENETSYFI